MEKIPFLLASEWEDSVDSRVLALTMRSSQFNFNFVFKCEDHIFKINKLNAPLNKSHYLNLMKQKKIMLKSFIRSIRLEYESIRDQ